MFVFYTNIELLHDITQMYPTIERRRKERKNCKRRRRGRRRRVRNQTLAAVVVFD
jgi:hypothetical protein